MTHERADDVRLVKLPGGGTVRERFEQRVASPTEPRARFHFDVKMLAGRPCVVGLSVHASPREPLTPDDLDRLSLVKMLDAAVFFEALEHEEERTYTAENVRDGTWARESSELLESVHRSARRARRRTVTPELLAHVVELYNDGGVPAVTAELGYSERNVRRLWARAAEVGLR
jgi:hypothetical protein